jgi:hypothetical protein
VKAEESAEKSGQERSSSKWVELIGPEYAAIIRPYRKLILVGFVGMFVGLAAAFFWMSLVGPISQSTEILGGMAFFLPGFAIFTTGLVLQIRLARKINRDLGAAKLPSPKYAPDLRNPSRFVFWSRHFGVTPEQVQEAGRRAAAPR